MEEMPYTELQNWTIYFDRRPVGWREDLRTAYLLQAQGDRRRPDQIFDSLARIKSTSESENKHNSSLKNSAMFAKLMNARGGDKLTILKDL